MQVWTMSYLIGDYKMPIRKTRKGYKISNVPGYSKTLEQAKKRLRAIKANQAARGKR